MNMTDEEIIAYWRGAYDRMAARSIEDGARIAALEAENAKLRKERDEMAVWIKDCTAKISNVIGGGSELFNRHGEQFRLDADFVCQRISTMRERHHDAMHRAVRAERAALEAK